MTVRLTDDQRLAVELRGCDVSVLAGAGTGKTHVLTERVLRRIVQDRDLDLRSLLAITFTEKAATQMKHRIAQALIGAGRVGAREEVDAAAISTIHSFCARLLREHAVDARVDPAFRVLDELEARALREQAWAAVYPRIRETDPARFAALASLPGFDPAETLLELHAAARQAGASRPGDHVRRRPELPSLPVAVRALTDHVTAVLPVGREGTAKSAELAGRIERAAAEPPELASEDVPSLADAEAVLAWAGAVGSSIDLRTTRAFKEALRPLREDCERLQSVAAEWVVAPLREQLAVTVDEVEEEYERLRGAGRALDFDDLERRAVALLRDEEVRAAVRARWPEVFVDEFQDVSPVQAELVSLVQTPGRGFIVGDPKQSIYGFRGSDVSLFVRHHARVQASGTGDVTLSHSFRTRPEVLGVVNAVFRELRHGADGDDASAGIEFAPLTAGREHPGKSIPSVELALVPGPSTAAARLDEAAWIADRVVALVEGSEGEAPLTLAYPTDDDPDATRPLQYGDVAILLRATTGIKDLERALAAREVPYVVVKGRGFFAATEVVDLALLLEAVAQSLDDLRLATVLRSPACGLDDETLFRLTRARKGSDGDPDRHLAEVVTDLAQGGEVELERALGPEQRTRLLSFWASFSALRAERGRAPLAELVDEALEVTQLEYQALVRPNGRQRVANLRKVRALARHADETGEGDLRRFATRLRELREREVRETEATVTSGDLGAVSILTVHAAKGLEWPVVFVPDVTRMSVSRRSAVVCDAVEGVALSSSQLPDGVKTASALHIVEELGRREAEEAQRLLYVAMTRPEDHLVLSGAWPEGRQATRDWWDLLDASLGLGGPVDEDRVLELGDAGVSVRVHAVGEAGGGAPSESGPSLRGPAPALAALRRGEPPAVPADEAADLAPELESLLLRSRRQPPPSSGSLYTTSVSGLVTFARCPEEFRRRHVLGLPEPQSFGLPEARSLPTERAADAGAGVDPGGDDEWDVDPPALLLGRAVHRALERLVPEFERDVEHEVDQALRRELGGVPPRDTDRALLAGWVRGFRDSELGRRVAQVDRPLVRREQGFAWQLRDTVVRGALDLVFLGPDGWVVVDYKTADFSEAGPESALQMRLYALALEAITGSPPAAALLFSLPQARVVPVEVDVARLDEVRSTLVDSFEERTRRAEYGWPADPPCRRCAYATVCPGSSV